LWLALLGKLNTKAMLLHKGILIAGQPTCSFCSAHLETLDHLLLACPLSWGIWCDVMKDFGRSPGRVDNFKQFFELWVAVPFKNKIQRKF